jgi:hypothetical protein
MVYKSKHICDNNLVMVSWSVYYYQVKTGTYAEDAALRVSATLQTLILKTNTQVTQNPFTSGQFSDVVMGITQFTSQVSLDSLFKNGGQSGNDLHSPEHHAESVI